MEFVIDFELVIRRIQTIRCNFPTEDQAIEHVRQTYESARLTPEMLTRSFRNVSILAIEKEEPRVDQRTIG